MLITKRKAKLFVRIGRKAFGSLEDSQVTSKNNLIFLV